MLATIDVPAWVVAHFRDYGFAPLAWSQDAMTEAIRAAVRNAVTEMENQ